MRRDAVRGTARGLRPGSRKAALEVYERQLRPALASDGVGWLCAPLALRSTGTGAAPGSRSGARLARIARLFNFYAYEGNLPAAAAFSGRSSARARGGGGPRARGDLYGQIGDFDQASRYIYTSLPPGRVPPGSPGREARARSAVHGSHRGRTVRRPRARAASRFAAPSPRSTQARRAQRLAFADSGRQRPGRRVRDRRGARRWLPQPGARAHDLHGDYGREFAGVTRSRRDDRPE